MSGSLSNDSLQSLKWSVYYHDSNVKLAMPILSLWNFPGHIFALEFRVGSASQQQALHFHVEFHRLTCKILPCTNMTTHPTYPLSNHKAHTCAVHVCMLRLFLG